MLMAQSFLHERMQKSDQERGNLHLAPKESRQVVSLAHSLLCPSDHQKKHRDRAVGSITEEIRDNMGSPRQPDASE